MSTRPYSTAQSSRRLRQPPAARLQPRTGRCAQGSMGCEEVSPRREGLVPDVADLPLVVQLIKASTVGKLACTHRHTEWVVRAQEKREECPHGQMLRGQQAGQGGVGRSSPASGRVFNSMCQVNPHAFSPSLHLSSTKTKSSGAIFLTFPARCRVFEHGNASLPFGQKSKKAHRGDRYTDGERYMAEKGLTEHCLNSRLPNKRILVDHVLVDHLYGHRGHTREIQ